MVEIRRTLDGSILVTEDTEEFWEAVGNDILSHLPKKRQPVKWWYIHKPSICGWHDGINKRWTVNLPRLSYSRSWVGYLFIHTFWFNRWSILFVFGNWENE